MNRYSAIALVTCVLIALATVLKQAPARRQVSSIHGDTAPNSGRNYQAATGDRHLQPGSTPEPKSMTADTPRIVAPTDGVNTRIAPVASESHYPLAKKLPPELLEQVWAASSEYQHGNYDHAALIALGALEESKNHPQATLTLLGGAGLSYEKLGYKDLAMEKFREALAQDPEHRISYDGMRRLSPEFAANHPNLSTSPGRQPIQEINQQPDDGAE